MMDGSDSGSGPPPRKLKFAPKIPVRKSPKPAVVKTDLSARTDDIVDRELLAKLSGAKSQDNGRRFKSDKKDMSASKASKVHLMDAKGILCLACLEESNRVKRLKDSDMKSPYIIKAIQILLSSVGLILRAMGFDNSTRIYFAASELFGGDLFMKPFRALFPYLENHNTVIGVKKLEDSAQGLVGAAVDYMVCLFSDIFMPTYDGLTNFANNLLEYRLYYDFRTITQPDRKALTPIFIDREEGRQADFEENVRQIMFNTKFGGLLH